MKINNVDISNFSAKLLDRKVATSKIISELDWLDGEAAGRVLRQGYEFRDIELLFLVSGSSEEDAYKKISLLTEQLKKSNILFDDISFVFPCVLNGSRKPERVSNGVFKVTFTLKNDWAIGTEVVFQKAISSVNATPIEVEYIESWATSAKNYASTFDEEDLYIPLAKETFYINNDSVAAMADNSTDWTGFFLKMGVDINKYKPIENNTMNGFVNMSGTYTPTLAKNSIAPGRTIKVYYNRFSKDGYPDLPIGMTYPSFVWSSGPSNTYYFDLGVGNGLDIQDLSIEVYGRFFDQILSSGGNGAMFGNTVDDKFTLAFVTDAKIHTSNTSPISFPVIKSKSDGSQINVETYESVSGTPIRKYGFKSSNDRVAGFKGFADVIWNGRTLDRIPVDVATLGSNLTVAFAKTYGVGKSLDVSRVRVIYQGKVIRDAIPIPGHVKNGFFNRYDSGLYDINKMEFLPWTKVGGTTGAKPPQFMTLPNKPVVPEPPAPIVPKLLLYKTIDDAIADPTGVNSIPWAQKTTSGGYPKAGGNFVAVFSQPNETGQWEWFSDTYFTPETSPAQPVKLPDGRWSASFVGKSLYAHTNQYIQYTKASTGEKIKQVFCTTTI